MDFFFHIIRTDVSLPPHLTSVQPPLKGTIRIKMFI
nr:MAG TPA: hypothetical protein [Caudoviricetes sp.]